MISVEKSKLAGHHFNGWLAVPAAQQNVAGKIKCAWYPDTTDTMIIRPWLLLPDITILLLIFAQAIPVSRLGRGVTVIQAVAPLVSFSVDDSSPPPRPPSLYQPPATSATCTDMSIRCANHHHCQVSTHHTTITIV